jgi:multiple sugar transport system substrate-binding protein
MAMHRVKQGIIFFIALSFLTFFTTGCAKKNKGPVPVEIKVAFWGAPEDIEIIKTVVSNWQVKHPDIKVKLEHTPYPGYLSKILTRIAGGAPPDIICTETNLFVNFFYKDVFLDMTPFILQDTEFKLEDFFSEAIDRFSVSQKVYGIPRDTAPFACIFYNKKLFDEAGIPYPTDDWNWDDFLQKAKKLTRVEDGRMVQYGFYGWAWQNFVYSNGGRIVDSVKNPKRCLLNDTNVIEGIKFYVDLIHKHKVAPAPLDLGNLGIGAQQLFMSGRLAMFSSGIWETPILRKIKDFDWDVAMFPKGPKGIRGFGTGGSAYSILKTTSHPKECWEVIKCLAGRDGQIMLAETGLAQPAIRDISEGEHWAGSPKKPLNKKMLNEAVKYAQYDPFHPRWREIQELFIDQEFDLVFNGTEKAEDAIGKILPKINEVLKLSDK